MNDVSKGLLVLALVFCGGCAVGPSPRLAASAENVLVRIEGQGSVRSDDGSLDCHGESETCTGSWVDFDRVLMTATPDAGWRFAGWHTASAQPYSDDGDSRVVEAVFVLEQRTAAR